MSAWPFIAGAGVLIGTARTVRFVRRQRRRREGADDREPHPGPPAPAVGSWRTELSERRLFGDTGLVAAREIRERLRGRFFKAVTLVLLGVVAAAIVIPTLHHPSSAPSGPTRVGVTGPLSSTARNALIAEGRQLGTTLRLVPVGSVARARAQLAAGNLTVVIEAGAAVVVPTADMVGGSTTTGLLAGALAAVLGFVDAVAHEGLSPAQVSSAINATAVPVHSLKAATHDHNGVGRSASVIGLILTFVMLTQYLGWTLMGVLEEKTSRVVEVLLGTVRPVQLLAGKVVGIGAVALAQAAIVVAFALVLAKAVGSDLFSGTGPAVVFTTLLWLVLGYAFYSWVYAAAGSMAARQDQVQSLALPLSIPIIVGYIVGLTNAGPGTPSVLVTVFAYLPPTAPFAMPVLVAHGLATWWEVLLTALLSLACTVVVARAAAGIYRRAVLRTGRRVSFREALGSGG